MPPPSPRTKPSRSRSNGRLARLGSSLRVDMAVRRMNPVTPNGWIMLWVPPESITSASPSADHLGRLADRLGAGRAGRQARRVRPLGPEGGREVPGRASPAPARPPGAGRGVRAPGREPPGIDLAALETSGGPGRRTAGNPAAPRPSRGRRRTAPRRSPCPRTGRRPGPPATAAARANCVFRLWSSQRAASSPRSRERSKPFTSAAIRVAKVPASNSVIGPTPPRPSRSDSQVDLHVQPDRRDHPHPRDDDPRLSEIIIPPNPKSSTSRARRTAVSSGSTCRRRPAASATP